MPNQKSSKGKKSRRTNSSGDEQENGACAAAVGGATAAAAPRSERSSGKRGSRAGKFAAAGADGDSALYSNGNRRHRRVQPDPARWDRVWIRALLQASAVRPDAQLLHSLWPPSSKHASSQLRAAVKLHKYVCVQTVQLQTRPLSCGLLRAHAQPRKLHATQEFFFYVQSMKTSPNSMHVMLMFDAK